MVYYAQAWHLAIKGTPLFEEDFQAWVHGPVIPELFDRYKHFSWKPIIEDVQPPNLPKETMEFLGEVAEEYFACDAYELERMTHIEDPWVYPRKGLRMDAASNAVITKESMKNFYADRVKEEAYATPNPVYSRT